MVEIVSNAAPRARTIRRDPVSATLRLRPLRSEAVERTAAADSPQDDSREASAEGVRLEVHEDGQGGFIYRLIDCRTGALLREWAGDEVTKLREFLRAHRIQLLDRKI
jgi:hypothetical protein